MKSKACRMFWLVLPVFGLISVSLRAEEPAAKSTTEITLSPTVTYVTVKGNEGRFRQDHWMDDDWSGGLESARYFQDFGDDLTLTLTGAAILDAEQFNAELNLVKKDAWFVRAGFEQFRRHYDSAGGFYEGFSVPAFDPHDDLHIDNGRFYVEFGLTLPDLPRLVIGYERQYRQGEKSLLEWGAVTEGTTQRNIFPSSKRVDETVDIIRIAAEHQIGDIQLANQFRVEFYDVDTKRFNTSLNLNTATAKTVTIRENYDHTAFYNAFRMDSHLNEKVYWSLGYLFNDLSGDAGLNVATPGPLLPFDKNWTARAMDLDQNSHLVNFNLMAGAYAGFTFYGGLQAEQTDTDGDGTAFLTEGVGPTTQNDIHSSNDKTSLEETLGVRFTKIPFTTLYAEGRWTQQQNDLSEREIEDGGLLFRRSTDGDIFRQKYSVGFNTAPLPRVTLSGRYRHTINDNDYDQDADTVAGYPAFIKEQEFTTDELMAKITIRPMSKLSIALSYQLVATDIDTTTDAIPLLAPGGQVQSGNYDSSIYSVSATLTPISRLYLMGLVSYQDTRTSTKDNGAASIIAYEGDVFSVMGSAGYAITEKTDLNLEYTFYGSDNYQNNAADGLPLGLDNESHSGVVTLTQKLNDHIVVRGRYGIYYYNEPQTGGYEDYLAHLAALTCTLKF